MKLKRYHRLKTIQPYFNQVLSEQKKYELRKMDRDFRVGDFLLLEECVNGALTGNKVAAEIESILSDVPDFGLQPGFCILGIDVSHFNKVYVRDPKGKDGQLKFCSDAKWIIGPDKWDVKIAYHDKKTCRSHSGWKCTITGVDFPDIADTRTYIEVKPELQTVS